MATRRVIVPQGQEWTVRRKWVPRRLRWRGKRDRSLDLIDGADLTALGDDLPVVGVILAGVALLLFAVGAVLFVVPALILVLELMLIVALTGLGLAGRVLFGRPWTVEACRQDTGEVYEWKVKGWRASQDLVQSVADELRTTGAAARGVPVGPHEPNLGSREQMDSPTGPQRPTDPHG